MRYELSERRCCKLFGLSRTTYKYCADKVSNRNEVISMRMKELAYKYPRYGYRMLAKYLRKEGFICNDKKAYRIYKLLDLQIRRKKRKRLPSRIKTFLEVPERPNICWSIDFMSDSLFSGKKFRTFNVMDDFNREGLGIEIDTSLPATRVIRLLESIGCWRGFPKKMRLDNGPELISNALADWAKARNIELDFIEPGNPQQNAYIERFNGTYRKEVLSLYCFSTLEEVRTLTDEWLIEYNYRRPHSALNDLTPREYLMLHTAQISRGASSSGN